MCYKSFEVASWRISELVDQSNKIPSPLVGGGIGRIIGLPFWLIAKNDPVISILFICNDNKEGLKLWPTKKIFTKY